MIHKEETIRQAMCVCIYLRGEEEVAVGPLVAPGRLGVLHLLVVAPVVGVLYV